MVYYLHLGGDAGHPRHNAGVKTEALLDDGIEVGKSLNLGVRWDFVLVGNGCCQLGFYFAEFFGMGEKFEQCSTECVCYIRKRQRRLPNRGEEGDLQPVVPSPASPISCASCAILASVFSSSGSELPKIPSKIVLLISSGFGELLILRTLFIHHYHPLSALELKTIQGTEELARSIAPSSRFPTRPEAARLGHQFYFLMQSWRLSSKSYSLSRFHFTRTKMKEDEEGRTVKKCASSYHLLSRHLEQIGNK